MLLPFQGVLLQNRCTQGDALGYKLFAPSGRIAYCFDSPSCIFYSMLEAGCLQSQLLFAYNDFLAVHDVDALLKVLGIYALSLEVEHLGVCRNIVDGDAVDGVNGVVGDDETI